MNSTISKTFAVAALCSLLAGAAFSQEATPGRRPVEHLDADGWKNWSGVEPGEAGAALAGSGAAAVFRYPDGLRGFYKHGFRVVSDSTGDWRRAWGVRMEVELPDEREATLIVGIRPASAGGIGSAVESTTRLRGKGRHAVTLPWRAFGFEQARTSFLGYIKEMSVALRFDGGGTGRAALRDVCVIEAPSAALQAEVAGKSITPGRTAEYPVTVSNCTDAPQAVALSFIRRGWEAMRASVEPAAVSLAPGESRTCTVRVLPPEKIPPGGHEEQTLQAIANGDAATASTLVFTTTATLPHPYILHTPARWQEVRDKVKNYPWAKAAQDEYVQQAERWTVPEIARPPRNDPDDTMGPYLFRTDNENGLMASGIAWQLTGDRACAEKIALFLRRLSDPSEGYAKTLRGCHQGLVQEGHFFQHIAMAYDMALDSGVFTDADRRQIEAALRVFPGNDGSGQLTAAAINNWNLSEVTGAFYVSLALGGPRQRRAVLFRPGGHQGPARQGHDGRRLVVRMLYLLQRLVRERVHPGGAGLRAVRGQFQERVAARELRLQRHARLGTERRLARRSRRRGAPQTLRHDARPLRADPAAVSARSPTCGTGCCRSWMIAG